MIRGALVLPGLLAALGSLPTSASAGTYEVAACSAAPEAVNNSWTWATTDPAEPSHYAEHATCPFSDPEGTGGTIDQKGGLATTDALGLSNGAAPGTSAGWTFTAPAGTTVSAINYERYLGKENDTSNTWSPALRADGTIIPGETCTVVFPDVGCLLGGPPGQGGEPGIATGLSAHQLSFGLACQAPVHQTCVTGATLHAVWAAMYAAKVTVTDPTAPTLGTPSGALWESGAFDGYHKRVEAVTISAQDIGGGVASISLSADGHPVSTYTTSCNFTFPQPCPLSTGTQTLALPTASLTDGAHTLALEATDAAGNQSTIASETITIDNQPPPPPVGLSASPTEPNGSTFNTTWTNPGGQIAPITQATYEVCPATSAGPCSPPTPAPASGPAIVTVPGPGSWSIAVWLTDAAGNGTAANAARTAVTVPADGSAGQPPGGSGPAGPKPAMGTQTRKATIHLSETLHGRELTVHISGPANGHVRVGFNAQLGHRTVASATRTLTLRRGQLTATFKLGPRTAAHATIRITAKRDNEPAITSTLRRSRAR